MSMSSGPVGTGFICLKLYTGMVVVDRYVFVVTGWIRRQALTLFVLSVEQFEMCFDFVASVVFSAVEDGWWRTGSPAH
jgi:hypothetical protein